MTLPAPDRAAMAGIAQQRDIMGNAYQGQSRGVFGWVDPSGGNYELAAKLLSPLMVGVIMNLATRVDDTFAGMNINGAPPKGVIVAAATNLINNGFLPVFLRAPPSWISGHNAGVLVPLWANIADEGSKINTATLMAAQGDLQARVAEANAAAKNADKLLSLARSIASLGVADLYKAVKPGYDKLVAQLEANPGAPELAVARAGYPAARALMNTVEAALRKGDFTLDGFGGLGAVPALLAPFVVMLSSVSGWVILAGGVVLGVGGTTLFNMMGGGGGLGFFTLALLAGGGYYAYKKGYLAKLGLKPKGV